MKRALVATLFVCLTAAALVRIKLVAQESTDTGEPDAQLQARIEHLADQLAVSQDSQLAKLQATLRTPAGRIVVQDRVGRIEAKLREEAQANAIPNYLQKHFVMEEGQARLRKGQEAFREQLLNYAHSFNEDVSRLKAAMHDVADRLADDSDAERLLARFCRHEAGPALLYSQGLRERVRPGVAMVEKELGGHFAPDGEGRYVIPDSRRDIIEEAMGRFGRVLDGVEQLRTELRDWSADLATPDELHQRFKTALGDDLFIALISKKVFEDRDRPTQQAVDRFFERLEDGFDETADGLVISQASREQIKKLLEEFEKARPIVQRLRPAAWQFAARIRLDDELHRLAQKVLQSDIAVIGLAGELEVVDPDPAKALQTLLSKAVVEGEDGKLRLRDESAAEVERSLQKMLREYRKLSRKARAFDVLADKLDDKELAQVLRSVGGKFAAVEEIRRSIEAQTDDAFALWRDKVFHKTEHGYMVKTDAQEEIDVIFKDVAAMKQELQKDDF